MSRRKDPPNTPNPRELSILDAQRDHLCFRISELPHVQRIVEIGCFTGGLTLRLAEAYPAIEIIGFDPSTDHLRKARTTAVEDGLSNVRFDRADLSTLPMPDNTAGVIVAIGILGASSNPHVLLSEISRILAPGGCALLLEDVPEDGQTGPRSGNLLPSLVRPGRSEPGVRTLVSRCPIPNAIFNRIPADQDETFLEVVLAKPELQQEASPSAWRLS